MIVKPLFQRDLSVPGRSDLLTDHLPCINAVPSEQTNRISRPMFTETPSRAAFSRI